MINSITNKYIGKRFGQLTVVAFDHMHNYRKYYKVICDCGKEKIVCLQDMKQGDTVSCGCRKKSGSKQKTHGGSRTRLYNIWINMKSRCEKSSNKAYKYYGEKGVCVCDEWKDFANFKKWADANGYSDKLTIDRIDSNGNYCPENCRWVGILEQANNKCNNHLFSYKGITKSMAAWCRDLGLNYNKIRSRLTEYKWDVERAFEAK